MSWHPGRYKFRGLGSLGFRETGSNRIWGTSSSAEKPIYQEATSLRFGASASMVLGGFRVSLDPPF